MHSILPLPYLLDISGLPAHFILYFLKVAHEPVILVFLLLLGQFHFFNLNVKESGFLNGALAVFALSEHLLDHALVELAFALGVNQLFLQEQSLLLALLEFRLAQFELLAHLLAKFLVLFQLGLQRVDVGGDFLPDRVDLLFAVLLSAGLDLVVLGLVVR